MNYSPQATRVDIEKQPDESCLVLVWHKNWKAGSPPYRYFKTDAGYENLIEELKTDGWEVLEWTIGGRAWKDEIRPIRTSAQIRNKRKSINNHEAWYRKQGVDLTLNLAFYL